MAGEQLLIDPTGEATGTQLDISDSTAGYFVLEHDYPDPERDVVYASSIDTEGDRPAASRPKNILITATIRCLQPAGGTPSIGTIVKGLQLKIGKLIREGGTFQRVLPSGDSITFDVVRDGAHRVTVPADKRWVARQAADVKLTIECTPYGRGAAVTLTTHTATAKAPLVFNETGIKGDVPALASLLVNNASNDKTWGVWGAQSRYYSSAAGAALFIEAEDGTAVTAALNAGSTGASGGGTNKVMRHTDVGTTGATSYRVTAAGATLLSHVGTFRVFARVQALSTNTGIASIRIAWQPYTLANQIANDWIPIQTSAAAAIKGSWVLADLGMVTVPLARFGTQAWAAEIDAKSTVATDDIDLDWVMFIPADEGTGEFTDTGNGILTAGAIAFTSETVQERSSTTFWYEPTSYEGDLIRVPPAGPEGRTLRLIVLLAGVGNGNLTPTIVDAPNLDAITAQLTYRPRYLVIPEP